MDERAQKEMDERMGIIQTALEKVEASVAEDEDHLEESQIREEEACHGDQGQSDSSEGQSSNVMVEEPRESGLTGVESTSPLESQGTEPSMEVDVDSILPLTSDGDITVSPEEERMLMSDPTSVTGEMARLQVSSPNSPEPEGGETSQ